MDRVQRMREAQARKLAMAASAKPGALHGSAEAPLSVGGDDLSNAVKETMATEDRLAKPQGDVDKVATAIADPMPAKATGKVHKPNAAGKKPQQVDLQQPLSPALSTIEKIKPIPKGTPQPIKREVEDKIQVTYACGHSEGIAGVKNRPCLGCMKENRKKHQKTVRKAQGKALERKAHKEGRLPQGAVFHTVYDDEAVLWTGTLTIGDKVFTTTAFAVMKLLPALDRLYRASLQPSATGEISQQAADSGSSGVCTGTDPAALGKAEGDLTMPQQM